MTTFRARRSCMILGGWSAFEPIDDVDENGLTTSKKFCPHSESLPPVEKFEIDNLLRAGIPLQQMRTKILAPDARSLGDALVEMSDSDFTEMENNNKQ